MTAIAPNVIPEIAMKVKVGTAACAIALASAFPAVVANAETAVPAPIAPVMEVLSSGPILGPVDFAEQNFGWFFPEPGSDGQSRTVINRFSALILAAGAIVILPIAAFFAAVAAFVDILFQVGPYGTGRS